MKGNRVNMTGLWIIMICAVKYYLPYEYMVRFSNYEFFDSLNESPDKLLDLFKKRNSLNDLLNSIETIAS